MGRVTGCGMETRIVIGWLSRRHGCFWAIWHHRSVILSDESKYETASILFAMTEEHEHKRSLERRSKNPGFAIEGIEQGTIQTYPCAPRPPPGCFPRYLHLAP